MSLTQQQFETLVHRMERFAERSPGAYRWWVLGLALLGYGLLLGMVTLLLVLMVLLGYGLRHALVLAGKLLFVLGALLVVLLRSLWVRLEAPEGEPLTRAQCPDFFTLLEGLATRLNTPRVHRVLVTPAFNAAVMQLPRLGVFGWHRNYLLIGLPLMKCLSVQQFEAVLAHELGHLSRGHARLGNWIYRLRQVWMHLDQALAQRPQWGSGAIRRVLHWYLPYFNACSFPLARSNEFEADASSVQLTSAAAAAQALTNINVIDCYLREAYWPGVGARARDSAQPAFAPYAELHAGLLGQVSTQQAERWLGRALAEPTTYANTHPSLTDRLAAIDMKAQLALPAAAEAADRLLGAYGERVAAALDTRWRAGVAGTWKKIYQDTQAKRGRLTALREQATPLSRAETVELADLEEEVGEGAEHALRLRRELMAREPGYVPARFVLARQLLLRDDVEGVALMEEVIGIEADAIVPGCELLRDYCWRLGERERARQWHERRLERARTAAESKKEREHLFVSDTWLAHDLKDAELAMLVARLNQIEGLRCAYLVRKRLVHPAPQPLYVLGFGVTGQGRQRAEREREIVEKLSTALELPALILNIDGKNAAFGRQFAAVAGAQILG